MAFTWKYQKVTIDNTKVPSTQTDIPIYVDLSDLSKAWSDIFDTCRTDGGDIRVTLANWTELAREIVSIDTTAKTWEMRVKIPSLSSSADTVIHVYYDWIRTEPAASSTYWSENVRWSEYLTVHHMNDATTSTVLDSTSNNNDGTKWAATQPTETAWQLWQWQDFDGTEYINLPDIEMNGLANFTLQTVFRHDWWSSGRIMSKDQIGIQGAWIVWIDWSGDLTAQVHNGSWRSTATYAAYSQDASIHKLDVVLDDTANEVRLYLDAVEVWSAAFTWTLDDSDNEIVTFGADSDPGTKGHLLNWLVDESRILNTNRSEDRLTIEKNNRFSTASFYSASDEINDAVLTISENLVLTESPTVWVPIENRLDGRDYRKSLHIDSTADWALTNYQKKITINYTSWSDSSLNMYTTNCETDFWDIRFTTDDGETELDYYMVQKKDSDKAVFYVEIDSIPSSWGVDIYVYYWKTWATTTSNGANTFDMFEDFETWNVFDTAGAAAITLADESTTVKEWSTAKKNSTDSQAHKVMLDNSANYDVDDYVLEWRCRIVSWWWTNENLWPGLVVCWSDSTNNWYVFLLDQRSSVSPQIREDTDYSSRTDWSAATSLDTWYLLSWYRAWTTFKAELRTEAAVYSLTPTSTTNRTSETTYESGRVWIYTYNTNHSIWDAARVRKRTANEPAYWSWWSEEEPPTWVAWTLSLSETLYLSEVYSDAAAIEIAISENLDLSEVYDSSFDVIISISENLIFAEAYDQSVSAVISISESLGLSDSYSGQSDIVLSIVESLDLSESYVDVASTVLSITENLDLSESYVQSIAAVISIAESLDLSESYSDISSIILLITENLDLSESYDQEKSMVISIAENLDLYEVYSDAASVLLSIAENLDLSEAYSQTSISLISILDNLNLSEDVSLATVSSIEIAENLDLTETYSQWISKETDISENLDLSESFEMSSASIVSISENLNLSEVYSSAAVISMLLSDSLTFSEDYSDQVDVDLLLSESLNLSENVDFEYQTSILLSESLDLSDSVSFQNVATLDIIDYLYLSEYLKWIGDPTVITWIFSEPRDQWTISQNRDWWTATETRDAWSVSHNRNAWSITHNRNSGQISQKNVF